MAYADPEMQRMLLRAKGRALARLIEAHPDEYERLYADAMAAQGYVRVRRGRGSGWRKAAGRPPGGVVSERRSRSTGTVVQVVDNRDGSFDAGDLPWFTVCVDHGGLCSHPTRNLAAGWAPVPDQWCPGCQDDPEGQPGG